MSSDVTSELTNKDPILHSNQKSHRASRLATRLAFFVAGFAISCWAPLVPFVKDRIGADEAQLGSLLLCLGLGSVVAMPISGILSARIGSRPVILAGSLGMILFLPIIATAPTTWVLAIGLACFGAFLGALDVSANIHATEVQRIAKTPLMSNFHGFYSVGGLVGAGYMTALLSLKSPLLPAALSASLIMLIAVWFSSRGLLREQADDAEKSPFFVAPRGITLIIGILAFILFLVEGAILDWGAVMLSQERGFPQDKSGIGYTLFALAMTIGRLSGDLIIKRYGNTKILLTGSIITITGVALLVCHVSLLNLIGFFLIGIGASNLVPILFTATANQKSMPSSHAISAVSMMGYAGILLGPAFVGYMGKGIGLDWAFIVMGICLLLVTAFSKIIGRI